MEKKEKLQIKNYFSEVETTETYKPYFCSVEDAITIVIVGAFCEFRNLKQIHQWANNEKTSKILAEHFGVKYIPCYYWLTWLLKILNPQSRQWALPSLWGAGEGELKIIYILCFKYKLNLGAV